jgi:hypothetical protein
VPRARDLLARFRPVGAPGAAAPAGVPADRGSERDRELQAVFDELADTEEQAAAIRAAADREAAEIAARARERLPGLVARVVDAVRQDEPIGAG